MGDWDLANIEYKEIFFGRIDIQVLVTQAGVNMYK